MTNENGRVASPESVPSVLKLQLLNTVELHWLEHLWDYENMFETGVVRANEC